MPFGEEKKLKLRFKKHPAFLHEHAATLKKNQNLALKVCSLKEKKELKLIDYIN